MFLLMLVAVGVCLAQLSVVSAWARSVRFSTLVLAAALGFYGCGFVAVGLEWILTRVWHLLAHQPLGEVVRLASWTTDPVIEEVVKVLPIVGCALLLRRLARQLGLVDHLLIGAALGAGFELFEAALRFATVGWMAIRRPGGYIVAASLGGTVTVPTPLAALFSWLPSPAANADLFGQTGDSVQHLVWTALAGAGLGWLFRHRGRTRWLGLLPLVVATADHLNYNARAVGGRSGALSDAIAWVGGLLPGLLILALVATTVADRLALARVRSRRPEVLLTGEPASGLKPAALLRFVRVAPRWAALVAWRFVLARRAALFAAGGDGALPRRSAWRGSRSNARRSPSDGASPCRRRMSSVRAWPGWSGTGGPGPGSLWCCPRWPTW